MLIFKSCWCSVVKILIRNNQVFYEQSAHYLKKNEQSANNTEKPIYQVAKQQSPVYNFCVVSVVNFLCLYVIWNLLLELWKQSLVITLLVAAGGRHWYSAGSKLIHLPLYFCWMIVSSTAGQSIWQFILFLFFYVVSVLLIHHLVIVTILVVC